MLFVKAGIYKAAEAFSIEHFMLLVLTIIIITYALKYIKTDTKEKVKNTIKRLTICLWILEIIKIVFNLKTEGISNPNSYLPLYFCSIMLFAGLLSAYGKYRIERMGNIFLATGGIVGGIVFIAFPLTSLATYPIFHYISIYSFLFHGIMIYLGILINKESYIELNWRDLIYYATLILIVSFIALIINCTFGSNLMFISNNYPDTIIEIIYNVTGRLFTPIAIIGQSTVPFILIYKLVERLKIKKLL